MSGGVDSSIAAAFLKKQGHDVVGIFMKFWRESGTARENLCCSAEAKADARRIASKLNIPFYVLDVRKEFKKKVVDYLIEEYKKGNTPNPCVECNRWIKFKFLMDKALALKADYITTGHYVRSDPVGILRDPRGTRIKNRKLLVAKDRNKDQSYFLWTLNQKQLKKTLFPVGDYTKTQIRAMAKKWDLPVYEKKESQEICFIPDRDLRGFLKKNLPADEAGGTIITTKGEKVGEHEGLAYYTIGQRKGIKIGGIGPASTRQPSLGGPFYVVEKDFKKNALIVAQGDFDEALFKKEFTVSKTNWISKVNLPAGRHGFPLKCKVKIRYLTEAVPCTVSKIQNSKLNQNARFANAGAKFKICFIKPQRAITPGQSAVFYKGNEVLGGGVIM